MMRRGFGLMLALLVALLALTGLALAQETTPEPAPPTLTETPTATLTPTDTASPEPMPSPLPTATETPLPSPSPFPTDAASPTPETTVEATPPAEATIEVTAEVTVQVTAETTAEATDELPTMTPTASETPLPPEPLWQLVSSGDFEQGTPPAFWRFDQGWGALVQDGQRVFGPRSFGGFALFAQPPLLDTAVQLRVYLSNGVAAVGIRQSEAGGYRVTFEEGGYLRLYRGEQEVGQMFLGPIARQWRTLRLTAAGDVIRVSLDGAELITFVDPAPLPAGFVTLGGQRSIGSHFLVDDLIVWATEVQAPVLSPQAAAFAAPMTSGGVAGRIETALAYNSRDDLFQDVLTVLTPDGTTATYPGMVIDEGQPWSPDGQQLLVNTPGNDGIDVLNPSTGSVNPLTTLPESGDWTGDTCASWSPNGEWVAFLSTRRDGITVDEYGYTNPRVALYVVAWPQLAEPVRVLLASGGEWLGCPQWLNDDRIVLAKNRYPGLSALVSVHRSGADEHTHFEIEETIHGLAVSPESGKAAVATFTGCGCIFDVRVVKLDDDSRIELSSQPGEEEYSYGANGVRWNPDGTKLVMGRGIPDGREQDLVIADLSQPCPACALTVLPSGLLGDSMAWSPDGQWIASFRTIEGLFLFTPDGSEVLSILSSENTYISVLAWQPLPDCAAGGAMRAFSEGGDYCVPQPTPEPCIGYPIDGADDTSLVRARPERNVGNEVGVISSEGRQLLARWTVGTTQRWDDWYLVREPAGPNGLGWVRADVAYTSPRYEAACGLPTWDQPDAPANETIDLENLPTPELPAELPQVFVEQATALFELGLHSELRLPVPFTVLPASENTEIKWTQGYGLNTFAYGHSSDYIATNHIHSGIDFSYAESANPDSQCIEPNRCFQISAVCDGRIYAVSALRPNGTRRLTLRCSAPDGSLSNVYVVYSHLKGDGRTDIAGEGVVAGDNLWGHRVIQYETSTGTVFPHLHLEVYYYVGLGFYPSVEGSIRLNPLLFFASDLVNIITDDSIMGSFYPYAGQTSTFPIEDLQFEWDPHDQQDPGDITANRVPYTQAVQQLYNYPDYDLGIESVNNDEFTCLADTLPVADPTLDMWFRQEHFQGLQQLDVPRAPNTPTQVIRIMSGDANGLIERLQGQ